MNAPQYVTLPHAQAVSGPCVARAETFLVIMKIERVEIDTLLPFDLYNSDHFSPEDWEGHPLRKDYEMPLEYHGIRGR